LGGLGEVPAGSDFPSAGKKSTYFSFVASLLGATTLVVKGFGFAIPVTEVFFFFKKQVLRSRFRKKEVLGLFWRGFVGSDVPSAAWKELFFFPFLFHLCRAPLLKLLVCRLYVKVSSFLQKRSFRG
jgi:hypothetical protein